VNVAVTLGSKPERKAARLRELKNACDYLGFGLVVPGLENINLETRKKNPVHWRSAIGSIAGILAQQRPRMIFLPHEKDGHPTHIGTHFLVLDALKTLPREFECFVVETEFWGQMTNPNLVVESGVEDVAGLVAALACHTGEVRRNPYHARLPAWMLDNVRRGAEIVGGHGGAAPNLTFGTIYRFGKWRGGRRQKVFKHRKILSAAKSLAGLFDGI
jgi:LmbE family N-acetylglucosaminyl deacetylase